MNSRAFVFATVAAVVLFVSWGTDAAWLQDATRRIATTFGGDSAAARAALDEAEGSSAEGSSAEDRDGRSERGHVNPENYTINKFKETTGAVRRMYEKTADLIGGS